MSFSLVQRDVVGRGGREAPRLLPRPRAGGQGGGRARAASGLHCRHGLGDALEAAALGVDSVDQGDDAAEDHHARSDDVADGRRAAVVAVTP